MAATSIRIGAATEPASTDVSPAPGGGRHQHQGLYVAPPGGELIAEHGAPGKADHADARRVRAGHRFHKVQGRFHVIQMPEQGPGQAADRREPHIAGVSKRRAVGVRRAADDGAEAAVIEDHRRERARPLGLAEAAR
ncbi:MAG: hypothetical protein VB959_17735 [Rhodospirillales bacterium]